MAQPSLQDLLRSRLGKKGTKSVPKSGQSQASSSASDHVQHSGQSSSVPVRGPGSGQPTGISATLNETRTHNNVSSEHRSDTNFPGQAQNINPATESNYPEWLVNAGFRPRYTHSRTGKLMPEPPPKTETTNPPLIPHNVSDNEEDKESSDEENTAPSRISTEHASGLHMSKNGKIGKQVKTKQKVTKKSREKTGPGEVSESRLMDLLGEVSGLNSESGNINNGGAYTRPDAPATYNTDVDTGTATSGAAIGGQRYQRNFAQQPAPVMQQQLGFQREGPTGLMNTGFQPQGNEPTAISWNYSGRLGGGGGAGGMAPQFNAQTVQNKASHLFGGTRTGPSGGNVQLTAGGGAGGTTVPNQLVHDQTSIMETLKSMDQPTRQAALRSMGLVSEENLAEMMSGLNVEEVAGGQDTSNVQMAGKRTETNLGNVKFTSVPVPHQLAHDQTSQNDQMSIMESLKGMDAPSRQAVLQEYRSMGLISEEQIRQLTSEMNIEVGGRGRDITSGQPPQGLGGGAGGVGLSGMPVVPTGEQKAQNLQDEGRSD